MLMATMHSSSRDTSQLLVRTLLVQYNPFFQNGKLLKELNLTLVNLVHKSPSASSPSDYRPISCCNLLYKFITKILSNRMKKVTRELVSANHSAFLCGRNISDCTLLAHELVRDFKKGGAKACIKVDFQKAFDSVNMDFVHFVMKCMGFLMRWISWIGECIANPTFFCHDKWLSSRVFL